MRIEWIFIWTNLNPLHPRMHCGRFGWNWSSGSWEEDFYICQCIFAISLLSVLYLNKLESPSTKDALCQVWLKLVQGFFRWLKCEKFTATSMKQMMPTTTDNGQILIRKAHLRWAKNHCNAYCNTFLNIAIYHDKKTLHLTHKTSNMNMYYTLLRTKCF